MRLYRVQRKTNLFVLALKLYQPIALDVFIVIQYVGEGEKREKRRLDESKISHLVFRLLLLFSRLELLFHFQLYDKKIFVFSQICTFTSIKSIT